MKTRSILAAAAGLLLLSTAAATAATSKSMSLYKGKFWQTTWMAKNADGDPMCTMQTDGPNNFFFLKWTPTSGLFVHLAKMNWHLSEGDKVGVVFELYDRDADTTTTLRTETARVDPSKNGGGSALFVYVKEDEADDLMKAFTDAETGTIGFPDGDEGLWRMNMEGSRKATQEFDRCIASVRDAIASTNPTSPAKPTSPTSPTSPAGKTSPAASKSASKNNGDI